jgi:hypothetical protein
VQDDAPLPGGGLLCRKPLPSALLHLVCQVAHGLLGDDAVFAARKGSFGFIDCGKNLGAGALAFFPQCESLLYRIFFAVKPSALYRLTDKSLLIRGEV